MFFAIFALLQNSFKELSGIRLFVFRDMFGRADVNDRSASVAAVGTKVNDVVRNFYHVKIMLDNDDGVAARHKPLQDCDKFCNVVGMQSRRGLVQNIQRLAGAAFAEFGCEFHALRLAARKRGCGLTEFDVPESHVVKRLDFVVNLRNVFEIFARFLDGHFKDVVDVFALIFHFKRFSVIPLSVAHVAGDVNIRQEVHFDLYYAVAAAIFAPAARNVERKSARRISPCLRVGSRGKQFPYRGENARVRRGIAARSATDRRLIDIDDFIKVIDAYDFVVLPFRKVAFVQFVINRGINNFVDKAAFPAARNARNRG